ncbi:MAG: hypothetical protein GY953_38330, partial [bacterium]|nr:hypothetical protein [bacterium]
GKRIAFLSQAHNGAPNLYWTRADGSSQPQRLTTSENRHDPSSFSPNGERLAFVERHPETGLDIWTLPLAGNDREDPEAQEPEPFLVTEHQESYPAFSPDGRWLAYQSDESGEPEIYVRPFPGPGGKWLISSGGGILPVFSRKGRELFFQTSGDQIMVATYEIQGNSFIADQPKPWSAVKLAPTGGFHNYDLAPDGERFAAVMAPEANTEGRNPRQATFLLNFFDELK